MRYFKVKIYIQLLSRSNNNVYLLLSYEYSDLLLQKI